MAKRSWSALDDSDQISGASKRARSEPTDRLSKLSDELILKILDLLSVEELNTCQRLSQRFRNLSADSQIWKAKYYSRWVLPRALRIPGIRDPTTPLGTTRYSSKLSKWLEDSHLVKGGRETNWKRQYKLRHNWSKGSCRLSEVAVVEPPETSSVVAKYHQRVVYTADIQNGLRAWSTQGGGRLIASIRLDVTPISIAIDIQDQPTEKAGVALGFADGSFQIFELDIELEHFSKGFSHPASCNGGIIAIAYAAPYLLTLADKKILSLYQFSASTAEFTMKPASPRLLNSLSAHSTWSSPSLSIRTTRDEIIAGVAYATPLIVGWCVGLQELRINKEDPRTGALSQTEGERKPGASFFTSRLTHSDILEGTKAFPTNISYSHPYLLASHPDNTLSMYLVNSTSSNLMIRTSHRLWGHTSAVSGVQVSDRGKAVSVSLRGGETRIWDLEGFIRKRPDAKYTSVAITPGGSVASSMPLGRSDEATAPLNSIALPIPRPKTESGFAKGWIGFDDEQVLILREYEGSQLLHCYDFT